MDDVAAEKTMICSKQGMLWQGRYDRARQSVNSSLNKEAVLTEHQLDGSSHIILGAHIAISLSSHHPTIQSHHHHYVISLHYPGCPYLGNDDVSGWIVDGSATGLVVLAITRPPALLELVGQELVPPGRVGHYSRLRWSDNGSALVLAHGFWMSGGNHV